MGLATDPYRACYGDCRAAGGDITACMQTCEGLMAGDTCDPCCGLWGCFQQELPRTIEDVTGGIHEYVLQPVQGTALALAAAAVAVIVLIGVIRP